MWILKWANANRLTAAIIVVLLLVATASALDGYKTRKLLKAAQVNLEEADKAKEKELKAAQEVWEKKAADADRKLGPVLRERDELRAKLAARDKEPFEAPTTGNEMIARWKDLGYAVRVGPCN